MDSQAANETGGWSGSFLHKRADANLTEAVELRSLATPFVRCDGTFAFKLSNQAAHQLAVGFKGEDVKGQLLTGLALHLPCRKGSLTSGPHCCARNLHFRRGTTDFDVWRQIFQCHYLRYVYALFEDDDPPKYILDAGANVGMSTLLFKSLWPDATVVSLEPDPSNFDMLKRNTAGLPKVHPMNVGLWGRTANITQTGFHGNWGRVFKEAEPGESGMPAFSVQDLAKKAGVPAFDFVKIDIEGAEGMVFMPEADTRWIQQARLVSLEIHDYFHNYFGLGPLDISTRIDAAFNSSGYTIVSDNEHVYFVSPQLQQRLAALPLPRAEDVAPAPTC